MTDGTIGRGPYKSEREDKVLIFERSQRNQLLWES